MLSWSRLLHWRWQSLHTWAMADTRSTALGSARRFQRQRISSCGKHCSFHGKNNVMAKSRLYIVTLAREREACNDALMTRQEPSTSTMQTDVWDCCPSSKKIKIVCTCLPSEIKLAGLLQLTALDQLETYPNKQLSDDCISQSTADMQWRPTVTCTILNVDIAGLAVSQKNINKTDVLHLTSFK